MEVPKPYDVERFVDRVREKVVEVKVRQEIAVPHEVEKVVEVPTPYPVEKVVEIPQPYPVQKFVEKRVEVCHPTPICSDLQLKGAIC